MNDVKFSTGKVHLKANQIACLEYNRVRLYGEVIQLISHRQMCWFRPIYLLNCRFHKASLSKNFSEILTPDLSEVFAIDSNWDESKLIIDLRAGSDLLWPEILFRPAFDTEVLDFFAQLKEINHTPDRRLSGQKYLNNFLHQVWQSHQDKFSV